VAAQQTTITGASPMKGWRAAAASSPRFSGSRTSTNRHSCRLLAEGASRAASMTRSSFSCSTGLSR